MAEPTAVEKTIALSQGVTDITEASVLPLLEAEKTGGQFTTLSPEEFSQQASQLVLSDIEQFKGLDPSTRLAGIFGNITAGEIQEGETLLDLVNRLDTVKGSSGTLSEIASILAGDASSGMFDVDGRLVGEATAFATPEQLAADAQVLATRQAEVAAEEERLATIAQLKAEGQPIPDELFRGTQGVAAKEGAVARTGENLTITQNDDGTYSVVGVDTGTEFATGLDSVSDALARQTELATGSMPDEVGAFAPAPAQATLIDPATGDKTVVDVGSEEASRLLSEGFQLFSEAVGEDLVIDDEAFLELDSDALSEALTDVTTDTELSSFMEQLTAAQELAIEALKPSEATVSLQEQLAEQNSIIEAFQQSFLEGIETIEGQPIPMQFIAGQQAALERQAGIQLQGLSRVAANLIDQLDISVSQDQANQLAAMTTVDFMMSNIDLAFQIEDRLIAEEQRVFDRAMQLEDRARDTLTSILESFEGQYWENLTSDVKNELTTLANDAGISISLLESAMDSVANRVASDATGLDLASLTGYSQVVTLENGKTYGVNANGDLELIDVDSLVVPTANTSSAAGNTLLGSNGTITAYGSYEDDGTPIWPPGLDIQLEGLKDAAITLPYDIDVNFVGENGGFGNQVRGVLTSGPYEGQEVWLSHLDSFEVSTGEWDAGTVLGFQGATGTTRGPTGVHVDITMPNENGSVEYNGNSYLSPTQVAKIFAPEIMTSGVTDVVDSSAQRALDIILASEKFTADQAAAVEAGIASGEDPFQVILNQAKNIMGQTEATTLSKFETAREQMLSIQSLITEYYAKGGDTGIFRGSFEDAVNRLGELTDPELVGIGTQISSALQIYRNAVSGTAYSEQEGRDIAKIFPGINKSEGLNQAIISGRLQAFDDTIDSTYRNVLGDVYNDLLSEAESATDDSIEGGYLNSIFSEDVFTNYLSALGL